MLPAASCACPKGCRPSDPRAASKLVPGAPEGCVLRQCSRRFRIRKRTRGLKGSEVAKSRVRKLQSVLL
eukprot:1892782-Alexandrium_andersonii.AAC.2